MLPWLPEPQPNLVLITRIVFLHLRKKISGRVFDIFKRYVGILEVVGQLYTIRYVNIVIRSAMHEGCERHSGRRRITILGFVSLAKSGSDPHGLALGVRARTTKTAHNTDFHQGRTTRSHDNTLSLQVKEFPQVIH